MRAGWHVKNQRMFYSLKSRGWAVGLMLLTRTMPGQQQVEMDIGQMLDSAQGWAEENLDESLLRSLPEMDRDKVEKLLYQLQDRLQNDYVLNLASLNDAAKYALQLLDAHPETPIIRCLAARAA